MLIQIFFFRLDIGLYACFRSQGLSDRFSFVGEVDVARDFNRDNMILVPLDELKRRGLVNKRPCDNKEAHDLAHLFSDVSNNIP